ncbi:MAG: class I SAM-dependent DNA methyltransferase [Nitrospirota bacterium]
MPKVKQADRKNNKQESIEATLWQSADKLRKNMDAAEYKHVVLGLIFLKYISDAFEVLHSKLVSGKGEYEGADPEDPNEYTAEKVFFVPPIARWKPISDNAKKTEILLENGKKVDIGGYIDEAMEAIERQNPSLKGVLPKVYARQNLDRASLGGLIDLVGTIALGTEQAKSKDVLGQVYEYFLGQFALAEGKKGGQFYTPRSVVKLLVEMLEPYEGRVFDPCCGSGGMFVQSEKFITAHQDHYRPSPRPSPSGRGSEDPSAPGRRVRDEGEEGKILFMDARNLGFLINRRTKDFTDEDIAKITDTYHAWRNLTPPSTNAKPSTSGRGQGEGIGYTDIPGFCKSVSLDEIRGKDYVLTPGRYIGLPEDEDDFDFAERFGKLKAELDEQMKEEVRLNALIIENLRKVKING